MIHLSNGRDSIERKGDVIAYRQIPLPVFSASVPDALFLRAGRGITMKSKLVPLPHGGHLKSMITASFNGEAT
jgi:hypothetical protein